MPKIRVIVSVYNTEKFIEKCINSILEQKKIDYEIIIVNDGSTDNSSELIKKYVEKYGDLIKYFKKQNGGLSDARNYGVQKAQGDYLCFVDSDDYISRYMVQRLLEACQKHNAEIAVCHYQRFSAETADEECILSDDELVINKLEALEELHGWDGELYTVAWNKLYHRSLWENIRYPLRKLNEDEFTTYKLIYKAQKLAILKENLYYYYCNSDSITSSKKYCQNEDVFEAIEQRLEFFDNEKNLNLCALIEKAYLDRIINRYKMARDNNMREVYKNIKKRYKDIYRNSRFYKVTYAYTLFLYLPKLYLYLAKIKDFVKNQYE